MLSPRSGAVFVVCWCLAFGVLGSTVATAQFSQGSDQGSAPLFTNPDYWTRTIIDKVNRPEGNTVTFYLNHCEWVIYRDNAGRYRTCMPRPACDFLEDMGDTLQLATSWWENLADPEDALDFVYGGVFDDLDGQDCPTDKNECPAPDGWTDDGYWVVTRTYLDELGEECSDAASPALEAPDALAGGGCLRFYDDSATDTTTRSIREADLVFGASRWDNESPDCPGQTDYTFPECAGAWLIALVHEIGHCAGFSHAYLSRHTLEDLVDELDALGVDLLTGSPSIMSYDRPGSIETLDNGELNPYDKAVYLSAYSDPDPAYFAAFGTVVKDIGDNDCDNGITAEPLFGVGVIALAEASPNTFTPVHMSLTGVDPLGDGAFRLEHLTRGTTYRILVVDVRDPNQVTPNGFDFEDVEGGIPGNPVVRTDVWSEANSGPTYQYQIPARFETGFNFVLRAEFEGPQTGNRNEGQICVEFP